MLKASTNAQTKLMDLLKKLVTASPNFVAYSRAYSLTDLNYIVIHMPQVKPIGYSPSSAANFDNGARGTWKGHYALLQSNARPTNDASRYMSFYVLNCLG